MDMTLGLHGLTIQISADEIAGTPGGPRLRGSRVSIGLPRLPARYLRHGWQSWSLAAWTDTNPLPLLRPIILHPMQVDPAYVFESLPNGSWFGAVEFDGSKVLLLGALGLETHVRLNGDRLEGWSESGAVEWAVLYGDEKSIFEKYAELLGGVLGRIERKPAPRIWCSWYSLYTAIDEGVLKQTFKELKDLPFDVLQVDDGWETGIGDWEANAKFPAGMPALAANIKSQGRAAGLWLAPLIAAENSKLFRDNPKWFVKDTHGHFISAGFNWGQQLYALDSTHPEALEWLKTLMREVRAWGYDYLKLDFLYAGGLPGKRFKDMPREAALRQGLRALREGMGEDAYFVACGAPIFPALGICDALRVGPDVAGEWEIHRDAVLLANLTTPGTRNAIRTTLHRLWLQPLVQVDPDVAYFSSYRNSLSHEQKRLLQDLALICGFRATSDLPQRMDEGEREELRNFLEYEASPMQTGRYVFNLGGRRVNYSGLLELPAAGQGLDQLQRPAMGWLASQPWALRVFDRLNQQALAKMRSELTEPSPRGEKQK